MYQCVNLSLSFWCQSAAGVAAVAVTAAAAVGRLFVTHPFVCKLGVLPTLSAHPDVSYDNSTASAEKGNIQRRSCDTHPPSSGFASSWWRECSYIALLHVNVRLNAAGKWSSRARAKMANDVVEEEDKSLSRLGMPWPFRWWWVREVNAHLKNIGGHTVHSPVRVAPSCR